MTPDIVILGVGRSGTSKTAEILHRHFGVCFGHSPTMLQDFRGETVYEDRELKKMIKRVVKGEVGIDAWLRKFDATHKDCKAPLTGAKLLDFNALSLEQFMAMGAGLVVRTYRPHRSCVESWVRYRRNGVGRDEDKRRWAEEYVAAAEPRIKLLVEQLTAIGVPVVELVFDPEQERIPDAEIVSALEGVCP
jgi:hypothetical protein